MLKKTARCWCWNVSVPLCLERHKQIQIKRGGDNDGEVSTGTSSQTLAEVNLTQRVVLLPMLHAATQPFYDLTLQRIESLMTSGGDEMRNTDADEDRKSVSSIIMVEGVHETEAEADMQRAEWARAGSNPQDAQLLQKAATAYAEAAASNNSQLQDLTRAFCSEYSLRYPLPDDIILEDYYFKPLLAAKFGLALHNPDIVLRTSSIPHALLLLARPDAPVGSNKWLLTSQVSSYREREFVKKTVEFLDTAEANIQSSLPDILRRHCGGGDAESTSSSSAAATTVFPHLVHQALGVWGHAHCQHITTLLEGTDYGFVRQEVPASDDSSGTQGKVALAGGSLLYPVGYGWNPVGYGG